MASEDTTANSIPTKCAFVALAGAPNVGKSTLLNRLVGAKVSIVTHKVQTTRARVRAIAVEGASQLIFIDTPGIFQPRRRLEQAMVNTAWAGVEDADIVLFLIDAARGFSSETTDVARTLAQSKTPIACVINKIDLVRPEKLLPLATTIADHLDPRQTYMVSAETGDGVPELVTWLKATAPEGPWLYPEDQLADLPLRLMAAEITREKLMLRVHEEIPYAATVETETWQERKDGSLRLEQTIYVRRESQRKIMLGKKGAMIKTIGSLARADLEQYLGRKVHLFLFVKVRKNWEDDPERYRQMGLEFPR